MSHFEELLKGLTLLMNTALHVDPHGVCQILVNRKLHIQLTPNRTQDELLIASLLGEIPPGKFRENTLKEALKENYPASSEGILSYCEAKNQLTLFAYLPLRELSSETLYAFIKRFTHRAETWKTTLGGR